MQFPGQAKPAVGIVYDTAIDNRIEDVLALALLYGLDGKNEARVVSISVANSSLQAAQFCDAVSRFYAGEVNSGFGGAGRTLPLGLADFSKVSTISPMITAPLAKKTADGKPVYPTVIEKLNDTAEVPALIRNAFTAQYDGNCIVVLTGPATDAVKVLDVFGAKQDIVQKVRYLVWAGGAFPDGKPEFNVETDIPAARRLFAEWPTPIVCVGSEVGEGLPYPGSSIESDFTWTQNHPIVDAYRAFKPMPYDAPTSPLAALLYAVRIKENYFKLSDPGTISVLDDGRTKLTPSEQGKQRYLILDPAQKDRIIKAYVELVSAKPAPPKPRFRRPRNVVPPSPPQQPEAKPKPPVG
ncbi:MAG TPA: nucleoside hydrolase [Bryobacteraceae bacterium]|nr:nucleoside hydrolase [Bryobacteraceae bacterium]